MRILLVDDDASVLEALLAVLNTFPGHDIRTAGVGGEALAAANQMEGADLLITDVVMEPMDGFTLRDRLTAKYPDLRTILISGYDLSDYPEQVQGYQLLTKPIDPDALLAAVAAEFPAPAVSEPELEQEPEWEAAQVGEAVSETTEAAEPALEEAPFEPAVPESVAEPEPAPGEALAPAAIPVAVPTAARPSAVPVARPSAVPTGQPAATVKAIAVPRPSPVAVPVPMNPATGPSAPSPSTASPNLQTVRVTATVKAKPIPPPSAPGVPASAVQQAPGTAVPAARAITPSGQPVRATAVPTPRSGLIETKALSPVPASRPPTAPSTVSIPVSTPPDATLGTETEPVATGSGEDLSGHMLGAYQIHRKLSDSRWGSIYAGLQTSINRPVAIEVLDPAKAADPASQARFVADARAKAAVQHPSILAV